MIVTLDIFSGRPNPSWRLSEKNAKSLVDRIAGRAMASAEADAGHQMLGFRGLIVSASDDAVAELSAPVRIGGGASPAQSSAHKGHKALSIDDSAEAVRWLLGTGAHAIQDAVAEAVHAEVESRLQGLADTHAEAIDAGAQAEQAAAEAALAAACIIANTAYNPGFWNTPAVQPKNNCYNYAMNFRSDTFAQPGRISGHPNGIMDCAHVSTATNFDGCLATCSGSNKNVALVIWPGVDYHWYRRHAVGFWGHKPGGTAARNVDNAGQLINGTTRTPANCNRGGYTIFCGYRFSPTGMKVN